MEALEIFQRYELKYLIPYDVYEQVTEQLQKRMKFDPYGDENGCYNIVSLYFDSKDDKIYNETRNNLNFRQKLRLRVYGESDLNSTSFLEIKQKYNRVVNKRRTLITLSDAYDFFYNNAKNEANYNVSNRQILGEVNAFSSLYELEPSVVVSYDRQALAGIDEPDLRVTFDFNLMTRNDNLSIEDGPDGNLFVDQNMVIMEVKVSNSVPYWLSRMLSDYECERKSVSKFCTCIDMANGLIKPYQPINPQVASAAGSGF
ncbi:hypothetical protein JCM19037_788 [Geomicrobium sp. JCM 19037]|uniref:polyphosphate polymerase domain-containing protein n=1 Tax=Geomicrobium sp. JCM 19037 TaxID=1460634 RepID=UPI00045F3F1C|nr:polyphosphate polymerase domain-containing protein [Geomicrobium sp. JCM 19037]GAK02547.1 hypothetical protein JCM19037_788 [Geomicrobium sp. JCM 19037]